MNALRATAAKFNPVRAPTFSGVVTGAKSEYNKSRFEDLPPEVIFAEIVLLEVQQFIGIVYGTLIRFYLPSASFDQLD